MSANHSPSNYKIYINLNTQVLYDPHTLTFKHDCLHVAHHTTYLTDPENPPRVPSHQHTTDVSASTVEQARRTPSNMDASFSTGSFLFLLHHKVVVLL